MSKKEGRSFYGRLATAFNALLDIPFDYFGSTPRQREPEAGVQRAEARLAAHRKAERARLGSAYDRTIAQPTRQLARQMDRQAAKAERQRTAAGLRKLTFNQRRERGLITGEIA